MSKNPNLKERALKLLQNEARPLSAYDLIEFLRQPHQKLAPTTVYRALNSLVKEGVIHKIEATNNFMACQHEGHDHPALVAHCETCGTVEEVVDAPLAHRLTDIAKAHSFSTARSVIELHGTCTSCTKNE